MTAQQSPTSGFANRTPFKAIAPIVCEKHRFRNLHYRAGEQQEFLGQARIPHVPHTLRLRKPHGPQY